MRLAGKTAVITGGTSGIGLATAALFKKEGGKVIVTGQTAASVALAQSELGPDIVAVEADVRSPEALALLAQKIDAEFGGVDILFANAGVALATPLAATDLKAYDLVMDVNVRGVFMTVTSLGPLIREGGSIILNTSWLNQVGTAGLSALSASKAAVRSFARSWSAELLARRIRVNAVSPGAMKTPIHGKFGMTPADLEAFATRIQGQIPLGRFGAAEDIAKAALYLASDESAYVLGAELVVDGGFSTL